MLFIKIHKLKTLYQNGEFNNAGNIEKNFYNKYSQNICNTIDEYINKNEFKQSLEYINGLINYILDSNNIEYYPNDELCVKYIQCEKLLFSELSDKYLDIEYNYMVEQSNRNEYDSRTTYNLIKFIFLNPKYENDKTTQYNILTNKYEQLKSKDNYYMILELSNLKELYSNLDDFEKTKQYIEEIDQALKWQGTWIGFKGYQNRDPNQLAISYFGKKIYVNYVFNGAYTYSGVYKFKIINENTMEVEEESGSTLSRKAKITLKNDKMIFSYPLVGRDGIVEFSRETEENNYADAANKVLAKNPIKTNIMPKVGMTANEVKNSTWGTPDKINKDTYSWGTTEQWVYNNLGYVYLENGIVTSVSQR